MRSRQGRRAAIRTEVERKEKGKKRGRRTAKGTS